MDVTRYAAILGLGPERLVARQGQRHDVVLDRAGGVAWRFPRTRVALEALPVSAARVRAAGEVGLPAPRVVDLVTGPLGTARLGLTLLRGAGMTGLVTDELGPRSRVRLVRDLVALLGGLRSVDPPAWPGHVDSWSTRWAGLTAQLRQHVVPLIGDVEGRRLAVEHLEAAEVAAEGAGAVGLVHGDLGGENVLVDPVVGGVVGVLDWDDAAPGDPAVDLAAILAHAPPWLREGLFATDPSLHALQARAHAYTATFALQQALWGLQSGDEAELDHGLSGYRSGSGRTPSPTAERASGGG